MISDIFSPEVLTIILFGGLLAGILMGYPISFVMLGISLIVGILGAGPTFFPMMVMRTFGTMTEYILAAIPLFVFMGIMIEYSGTAEKLFSALHIWLGPLRGALLITTLLIGTILATCTGIVGASVTIMGILALPAMLKRGYDKTMSTGSICASGTLGILIPPSIMLVIYGPMAGISVVQLFAGAFIPGLILSGLYISYVVVRCLFNPALGPPLPPEERRVSMKKKLSLALTAIAPPFFLMLSVLGTIFFGIAAVTEAAAAGCLASLILAFAYGNLNWKTVKAAAYRTLTVSSMIMLITFAAFVFTGSFMMIGGKQVVTNALLGLPLPPWGMLVIMLSAYFVAGIFMDWIGIIPILVPLFTPVVQKLGFDPIWFGILCCVCMQTSFLTPPMALTLFYMKGVAPPEIDFMKHIVRGVIPFIILQCVGLALISIFPRLVLWLPTLLIKQW
jgi:tripartite ATP-independent transporter DctM subunit